MNFLATGVHCHDRVDVFDQQRSHGLRFLAGKNGIQDKRAHAAGGDTGRKRFLYERRHPLHDVRDESDTESESKGDGGDGRGAAVHVDAREDLDA